MTPLNRYAKIKNRYCVSYFGPCDEYILQLLHARTSIEKSFPGLELYVSCSNDTFKHYSSFPRIIPLSDMNDRKFEFAFIRELKSDLVNHPVLEFVEESGVEVEPPPPESEGTVKCVIWASGIHPTGNMPDYAIEEWRIKASKLGYQVQVGGDTNHAGWVIGVESLPLYQAACKGTKTTLIDTGIGGRLYKKWFPMGEMVKIR